MGKNSTDRSKVRTKRSVLTDCRGVQVGLAVERTNRNDFKLTRETIKNIAVERPDAPPDTHEGMCLYKGYDYDEVRELLYEFRFTAYPRTARGSPSAEAGCLFQSPAVGRGTHA